jgi:hypothetical protein
MIKHFSEELIKEVLLSLVHFSEESKEGGEEKDWNFLFNQAVLHKKI